MKHFFYKKAQKEIVPVSEKGSNKCAENKLKEIFHNSGKLRIPSKYIDNWEGVALYHPKGDVEKAKAIIIPAEKSAFDLNNRLNDLTAREWLPETVTVFSQKGLGANNKNAQIEKQHPAPFSYQDVCKLIKFYTKENDKVLDPFSGVASTVKACAISNRFGFGVELNKKYHDLGIKRINQEVPESSSLKQQQTLIQGDSTKEINKFEKNFFDFIVTSPPYWNILETIDHKSKERINKDLDHKYSESSNDLANVEDYEEFLGILSKFFDKCSKVLKVDKYMCVVVSDFRKKDRYHIFHADLANRIELKGNFLLKGIRILYQRHKRIYPYGYPFSFVPNMHHQNVLIFQNIKGQ